MIKDGWTGVAFLLFEGWTGAHFPDWIDDVNLSGTGQMNIKSSLYRSYFCWKKLCFWSA